MRSKAWPFSGQRRLANGEEGIGPATAVGRTCVAAKFINNATGSDAGIARSLRRTTCSASSIVAPTSSSGASRPPSSSCGIGTSLTPVRKAATSACR
ncbi:MAG: hypothetical protein JWR63_3943 [Conexibacter sp.]|nr:hypothetical protein [Conexibacter sp.]